MFQVFDEGRMAYQVLDADAEITLAVQIEPIRSVTVEPENLMLGAEQNRAFGHGRRQSSELAQEARNLRLVILLAPIQPVDDGDYFTPGAADVGRRLHT